MTWPAMRRRVVMMDDSNGYDFVANTFGHLGDRDNVRALKREYDRRGSGFELVREPDRPPRHVARRAAARHRSSIGNLPRRLARLRRQVQRCHAWIPDDRSHRPGHTKSSSTRRRTRRLSSGAEVISAAFYHAFGYKHGGRIPGGARPCAAGESPRERRFTTLSQARSAPSRCAMFTRCSGEPHASRTPSTRVLASRFAAGKPLGNFRYYRSRPDDPMM